MEEQSNIWKKLKKTKQREQVFRILSSSAGPMSAADIYQELLVRSGTCSYAISTVYRILQAFEAAHFVSKMSLSGSDMAYYEWNEDCHRHYAICLKCHKRIPHKECPFQQMYMPETEESFRITGHRVEVYGYCGGCTPE